MVQFPLRVLPSSHAQYLCELSYKFYTGIIYCRIQYVKREYLPSLETRAVSKFITSTMISSKYLSMRFSFQKLRVFDDFQRVRERVCMFNLQSRNHERNRHSAALSVCKYRSEPLFQHPPNNS